MATDPDDFDDESGRAALADAGDRNILRQVGSALYGDRFGLQLAAALGVSGRTVRYWLARRAHPAPGVWEDLKGLVRDQERKLAEAMAALDRHIREKSQR